MSVELLEVKLRIFRVSSCVWYPGGAPRGSRGGVRQVMLGFPSGWSTPRPGPRTPSDVLGLGRGLGEGCGSRWGALGFDSGPRGVVLWGFLVGTPCGSPGPGLARHGGGRLAGLIGRDLGTAFRDTPGFAPSAMDLKSWAETGVGVTARSCHPGSWFGSVWAS